MSDHERQHGGRPSLGERVEFDLAADRLDELDRRARAGGLERAAYLRRIVERHLAIAELVDDCRTR
jgi:hypothetical protein